MVESKLRKNIKELQVKQIKHDLYAHRDLFHALLPKKMTHYTLHFAKYQGRLMEAMDSDSIDAFNKALVDSAIITIASANAMNLDLEGALKDIDFEQPSNTYDALKKYILTVSRMAKACEVLDHLESYPSREVLENSIYDLFSTIDFLSLNVTCDIVDGLEKRWEAIEHSNFAFTHVFSQDLS
jgi:hypothetical protein